MTPMIRASLLLVALGTAFAVSCLVATTALSMTLFFMIGLPAYGVAAVLYLVEVARDLRRHRVL